MKSYHTLLHLLSIILLVGIASCSSDMTGPENVSSIMPLKVGNRWIYKDEQLNQEGAVWKTTFDTLEIVAVKDINGESWYLSNKGVYFTSRGDGLWQSSDPERDSAEHVAEYPANPGSIFHTETATVISDSVTTFDIISYAVSLDTGITVPAGTYHAVKYVRERQDTHQIWKESNYAPGIGNVSGLTHYMHGNSWVESRYMLIAVELK